MSIDLAQFLPTFLEESYEGLEIMETGLLNLQSSEDDSIHSIFRAAHSIKGGAGTFGFNQVTEFTHLVETLLDEMRDGRREILKSDIEILLQSVDCIRLLIDADHNKIVCEDESISKVESLLNESLNSSSTDTQPQNENKSEKTQTATDAQSWLINFTPQPHLVQTGNDPLFLFNALADLADLEIVCNTSELPAFSDIEPKELYLSWQIKLTSSDATEDDIKEVFEWVEDECTLEITLLTNEAISDVQEDEAVNNDTQEQSIQVQSTQPESEQSSKQELAEPLSPTAITTDTNVLTTKPQSAIMGKDKAPAAKAKPDVGSIRVGVDKVDMLINLVGELVITQSMLSELGNDFDLSKVEKLTSGLDQLLQNTKELQESVMRIRMLPISFAFNRFPRLIHDLSIKTGKQIELVIKGEQTELDKTVMEQIGDPLVHLVRNAADHGIESTEVRLANGKSEKGTISLNAYHVGGSIVIEVNDDGGGINREAVLNKAIEKGIVEPNSSLTDAQVFDLLFEPGFSTASEVTDISGRGVGMDVVKKNIQSLGGRIQVESEPGKGSCFKVNLPLTLAILDGQLVRVGTEVYIIPLITIVESLQAKAELINRVSGNMVLYRLREDNVPVLPIYQLFNLEAQCTEIENALLVVVEFDGQKVGLMVDDLLAQQQVVIKSLQDNYQQVDGISGATILGDGSVAMILDIPGMITMALKQSKIAQKTAVNHNVEVV
ncbi:chemotaxis protein CheA [uncultured Psychrosphaera sp.]|uniref:chemotaxis protein CheA n=1 Tax=uncultured Psychrosphaera sp. TaxID=1403522 RepID=UPI0026230BC6|nr:chemotaxis protein CheA [uncultured Psychrosphaera sp.]